MRISQLTNAPAWLKKATVENEDVEIIGEVVHWKSGTWKGGEWQEGRWHSGRWESGTWLTGSWLDGVWENGSWKNGGFVKGTWLNGTWHTGGFGQDAIWQSGIWRNGVMAGQWQSGIWCSGRLTETAQFNPHFTRFQVTIPCRWEVFADPGMKQVTIGCMTRPITFWDEFFKPESTTIYTTSRTSPAFAQIRQSYLVARAMCE